MVEKSKVHKGIYRRKSGTFYYRFKVTFEDGTYKACQESGFESEQDALEAMDLEKRKYYPKKCDLRRIPILFDDLFFDFLNNSVDSDNSKKKYLALYLAQFKSFYKRDFMSISDNELDNFFDKLRNEGYALSYVDSIRKLNNLLIKRYIQILNFEDSLMIGENIKDYIHNDRDINRGKSKRKVCVKRDYIQEYKNKSEVGLMGELFVIKYLKRQGIVGVHHTSRIDGDGAGYDIEVHNSQCDFYIEVKSTKGRNEDSKIKLTINELNTLRELGEKGNIYRVYNLRYDNTKVELYDTDREQELVDTLEGEIIFTTIAAQEKNLEPCLYECQIV